MRDDAFAPMHTATDSNTLVLMRFRDPDDAGFQPGDRLARQELDAQGLRRWRLLDTMDLIAAKDAGGWTWTRPDADQIDQAAVLMNAADEARDADLAYERARQRDALPWQKRLATAGRKA